MFMTNIALESAVRASLPEVISTLGENPYFDFYGQLPESLRLRTACCEYASKLLAEMLKHKGFSVETRQARFPELPRGLNSRTLEHTIIVDPGKNIIIDPSYSQFFRYVGLDTGVARTHSIEHIYPANEVAIIGNGEQIPFAMTMTEEAERIRNSLNKMGINTSNAFPPTGALRSATPQVLQSVYTSLWDPRRYSRVQE